MIGTILWGGRCSCTSCMCQPLLPVRGDLQSGASLKGGKLGWLWERRTCCVLVGSPLSMWVWGVWVLLLPPLFLYSELHQLLGYVIWRGHPSGGMDLGLVWGVPVDPTSPETIQSQVCLQKPTEGRVILATRLRASLHPLAFLSWPPRSLPEIRSCSPGPGKGRRKLGAAPSAWVRDGEGR